MVGHQRTYRKPSERRVVVNCERCSVETYRSGKCRGLIEVGVGVSGLPIYAPCPAHLVVEHDKLTAYLLEQSRAKLAEETRRELRDNVTFLLRSKEVTRATRAHARTRTKSTYCSCTSSTLPDVGLEVTKAATKDLPAGEVRVVALVSERKAGVRIPKSSLRFGGCLVSPTRVDKASPSRGLLVLENQTSSREVRRLVGLTCLLGVRATYFTFNELAELDWWYGDPRRVVPEPETVLAIHGYDSEGLLPEWVLQPIVSLLDERLESGYPTIVSFWKRVEDLRPRQEFEGRLISTLSSLSSNALHLEVPEGAMRAEEGRSELSGRIEQLT